jgi:peptide methionine sulfoxide reductase MsrA
MQAQLDLFTLSESYQSHQENTGHFNSKINIYYDELLTSFKQLVKKYFKLLLEIRTSVTPSNKNQFKISYHHITNSIKLH